MALIGLATLIAPDRKLSQSPGRTRKFGMQRGARDAAQRRAAPLTAAICAAHESEFLVNSIAQPVVRLETLDGNLFHLSDGVEMHL